VDFGESCDDGNVLDGDGCSATCEQGECTVVDLAVGTYAFCTRSIEWSQAAARCALEGGAIAVPRTAEEQTAIVTEAFARGGRDWWIGANDRAEEGTWTDPAGGVLDYTPWSLGRPNNLREGNCAILDVGRGGRWSDTRCVETNPVVCAL
jgi:cysteine-rich repeat protein